MEEPNLVEKLKSLQQKLIQQTEKSDKESQTVTSVSNQLKGFNILPKKILRKIFLFTDFLQDIPPIYSTCRLFNSVVRSRAYNVLLHQQVANKNSKVFSVQMSNNDEEIKLKPENEIKTKEEAVSQLRLAENFKQVLASKLKRQDNKNVELDKEIERIQEEIKAQKNKYSKGIEKMNDLEAKHENEKKALQEAQKSLLAIQSRNKSKVDELRALIVECEKDREKLSEEKKILRVQVLDLREKNVEIQKEIVVYQEVLNKIKGYFEGMEEAGLIKKV